MQPGLSVKLPMLSLRSLFIVLIISIITITDSFCDSQFLQTEFYYQGNLTRDGLSLNREDFFQGQIEDHDTIIYSERDNLGRVKHQNDDFEFDPEIDLIR